MTLSVWRIGFSGALTLPALGYGSTLGDGRWHIGCTGPLQLVYCGATPKNTVLLRLEVPDAVPLLDAELPSDWREDQAATQAIGMRWLMAGKSLGLWVPSFVEPAERNLLLNPAHPDYMRITLGVEKNPFVFDPRLC